MNSKMIIIMFGFVVLTGCAGTAPPLGVTDGKLRPCPSTPNCVNSQTDGDSSFVEPIYFSGEQWQAKAQLVEVIEKMERTTIREVQDNYIKVEFRSALFRFVDDVEFYFSPQADNKIIIHTRSASRLGFSDLGVNRKRIEAIRADFQQAGSVSQAL